MADFILGDVVARLRADTAQFNQALADIQQRLGQLNQASTAQRQQQAQSQQSTNQLATAYLALAQTIAQQTQAYTQVNQASLAYRQHQDQAREATRRLREEQRAAAEQARATAQAAQQGATAWRSMLTVAGGIGIATGIGALVGQMKELAVETVQTGARMEALRLSLGALAGSSTAGAAQFQQLFQTAQSLGVAFEPLASGFRQLTAAATQAGLPLADQQRLLTALAREARLTGASNAELGRAITAVAQSFSKGVVSMEELRQQLGEALPRALAATARGMGITTEALTKLIETGTLEAVPFAKALTRGFEEMQAGAQNMGNTAATAFNRLGNALLALKDALANSGLNEYLVTVVDNLKEAVEWSAKWLRGTPTTVDVGPQLQDLGLAETQVRQLQRLDAAIARAREGAAGARTTQRQEELGRIVTELERQREQLLESAKATQAQADAQGKVNAEKNKTQSLLERQLQFENDLGKALAKIRAEETAFREQARYAPDVLGDPKGTADQQETFARERQKALEKSVRDTTKFISTFTSGTGITVPENLRKELDAQNIEYRKQGELIDDLKEKERERKRAATEAATQARQAATQALQLDTRLEQLRAFTRRPSESPAEEARSRALVQGQQRLQQIEQEILLLEKSESLRAKRPEALPALRQLRETVRTATDAQAEEAYARALDAQMRPLQELSGLYGDAAAGASELAKAQDIAFKFIGTPREEEAFRHVEFLEKIIKLQREAAASAPAGMAAVARATRTGTFEQSVTDQLELLRLPKEKRLEERLRDEARRRGIAIDEDTEARLRAITAQERWNAGMATAMRMGDQAAQTITDGLLRIVDGTESVAAGFAGMAKSILNSISQLAMNEVFRRLIGIGLTAVGSLFAPTKTNLGGESPAAVGAGINPIMFQGGGVVHQPTLALIGERPANNPEYILNRQQMASLMHSARQPGPSAGGQAAGVTIINVTSQQQAAQEAARERGMGRQVIINTIAEELSAGSGSRIGRLIQAGGR